MARKRRTRKILRVGVPKSLFMTLNGIAGGDERKLARLVRAILEEKLATSTVSELMALIERKKAEDAEAEAEAAAEGEGGEE